VAEACQILENAVSTHDHPGYFPPYMRRLTADLYGTLGSINYELNRSDHGLEWYKKAASHRMQLLDDDTAETYDIEVMAGGDGNVALAELANGGFPDSSIHTSTLQIDLFGDSVNRGIWAANLSIAYRLQGDTGESMRWCKQALDWTKEECGDQSLETAM
jgi:hypothetical protein